MNGRILIKLIKRTVPTVLGGLAVLGGGKLFNEHCYSYQTCSGPSMYPSINYRGQWLLISKFHKHGKGLEVGDLVVFKSPLFRGRTSTKRVLGMPGDFVLKDAPSPGDDGKGCEDAEMIRVPEGHIWVIGDNLPWSRDSRFHGPIPLGLVVGKVIALGKSYSFPRWARNTLEPAKFSDE
ncbi:signal peptidase I [Paracoccidioides brasiliensis Pb18]|uniref:Mitochondrial inner membrane protease subunit n=1 Tax=Paracoccidioides brasiliensis (strain Pb18) TaxID=502780 RepID=C1GHY7_PARBD|nr:signal peptidase I [Paracoccidioides brasiliensis Pb18]EEH50794.1 signal peptidase I [Paracoccidioides brasiliensis Pb18]ODH46394.1 signal peptidase I [Paracoccidioides brasiliensis]